MTRRCLHTGRLFRSVNIFGRQESEPTWESQFILQCWRHQTESLSVHEIQKVAEATEEEDVPLEFLFRPATYILAAHVTWYLP